MNPYYFYKSLLELREDYKHLLSEIEENEGEITEEIKEKFIKVDDDHEATLFSAYNIMQELKGSVETRQKEIDRLQKKNDIAEKSIDAWKKFVIEMVKIKSPKNESGNQHVKVNDVSFTVSKSKSLIIHEDFDDERFTKWVLKDKIPTEHKTRIENYLKNKISEDIKFEKTVDKNAVKKEIDSGVLIKGAEIQESDKLILK